MSRIEVRIIRGNCLVLAKSLPMPFFNARNEEIGQIVAIHFDGECFVGTVELNEGVALAPESKGALFS